MQQQQTDPTTKSGTLEKDKKTGDGDEIDYEKVLD